MAAIIFGCQNRLAGKFKMGLDSITNDPLFEQHRTIVANLLRPLIL